MKKWTIVLLQSKKPGGGYDTLFKEYPPDKVICLHYDEFSVEKNSLNEIITKEGGELFPVPIDRIENATPENRALFASLPYEILRKVINALRDINSGALRGKAKLVFPIFSGSSLHSQLMLSLAVALQGEVATIDTTHSDGGQYETLQPQRWIRKALSVEFNTVKQKNALRLFLLEFAESDSLNYDGSQWLDGNRLAGGKGSSQSIPLPGSALKKSLQLSIDNGLVEEDEDSGRHLYRLTGAGWLVALMLIRDAIQSTGCPLEEIESQAEKEALCSRFVPDYIEKNTATRGRIIGVKGLPPKRSGDKYGAIEISNILPYVDYLITIYSKIDDNLEGGIHDPRISLDEGILGLWDQHVESRDLTPVAEGHIIAKGNLENLFATMSKWLWSSMCRNSSSTFSIDWEMDITQFDRNQNVTCGLFGFALGINQTYVVRRKGRGARGEVVPEIKVRAEKLCLQLPNVNASLLLGKTRNKLAGRYLVALSFWEEEQENQQKVASSSDFDSFFDELNDDDNNLNEGGVEIQQLRKWAEKKISEGDNQVPNLGKSRSMRDADTVLVNSGLVYLTVTGKRRISLTPLGRLIADWLKIDLEGED